MFLSGFSRGSQCLITSPSASRTSNAQPLSTMHRWLRLATCGSLKTNAPFATGLKGSKARHHSQSSSTGAEAKSPGPGFHIAFRAPTREAVDRFHAAALSTGGVDEGPPGIRESYDLGYYAAFVRDLDGHRVEAVLHEQVIG